MAIRIRKLGHSHKLTVPTVRKGLGVSQAGRQVMQNKATVQHPGASYSPYEVPGDMMGSGGTIHIKKANRGKFTAYKARTGKTTAEALHSKDPHVRAMANFARNAKKWKHETGGYTHTRYDDEGEPLYELGGRTINPAMGGQMIGGQHAYPPLVPYPAEYGFGGVLQSFAPFLNMVVPGAGVAAGMVGGVLENQSKAKQNENKFVQQDKAVNNPYVPTFSWGGRLPETRTGGYGPPGGLTMGHVPGYDSDSNYGGTNVPGKGWDYRNVKGKNEGTNWHRETNMNVRRHTYDEGGEVPVQLEKQEVFQQPDGQMGQVNGPSHAEGGVNMELPENSFIWSDKLKTAKGTTFADEAGRLGRMKAKYEKILKA
jgi:hypothetical protein